MSRTPASLLAVLVLLAAAIPAHAKETKAVKLVNVATGRVLAIMDNGTDAGNVAATLPLSDSSTHGWALDAKGDKHFMIRNLASDKVLDVPEHSKEAGKNIIIWDAKDKDHDNQLWSWEGEGDERRIKSKLSGLVLDVNDDGVAVQNKLDAESKSQLWKLVAAE